MPTQEWRRRAGLRQAARPAGAPSHSPVPFGSFPSHCTRVPCSSPGHRPQPAHVLPSPAAPSALRLWGTAAWDRILQAPTRRQPPWVSTRGCRPPRRGFWGVSGAAGPGPAPLNPPGRRGIRSRGAVRLRREPALPTTASGTPAGPRRSSFARQIRVGRGWGEPNAVLPRWDLWWEPLAPLPSGPAGSEEGRGEIPARGSAGVGAV